MNNEDKIITLYWKIGNKCQTLSINILTESLRQVEGRRKFTDNKFLKKE